MKIKRGIKKTDNPYIEHLEESFDFTSMRVKLTAAFMMFAMLILGCLWVLQTVFLNTYYEHSMKKRAENAIIAVKDYYITEPSLDVDAFCGKLSDVSAQTDIYFSVEAADGSFSIDSTKLSGAVRVVTGAGTLVSEAKMRLEESRSSQVSFIIKERDRKILVSAARIDSAERRSIYLVAVALLTPLDSAISILASQLFFVTIAALILSGMIAAWYSKQVSRPLTDITESAKRLGRGDYNVTFKGGNYTEIEELAQTLTETTEALQRADVLQKDLMANVSHDLRTPLTMIKSYAELIRDISGEDEKRRNEHLSIIIEETDRLSELVGDILTLSKMQAGTEEMNFSPVDIQKAAESVLATYRVLEENAGFVFEFNPLPVKVIVKGDEKRLQQVFSNLISNAVRYSAEEKFISVSFEPDGNRIKCSVRDKGIGIAKEDQDAIWNRYQRASRTGGRLPSGGTGLGLSIAREVLERHNADYGVESTPGAGSTFWFSLPCMKIISPDEPSIRALPSSEWQEKAGDTPE